MYARVRTASGTAVWVDEAWVPVAASAAELFAGPAGRGKALPAGRETLAPAEPTKIVCVGLNYRHHAREMNKAVPEEPLLFLKPPSSLIASGGVIELPPSSSVVHHEGELAVVIGARVRKASASDAARCILGVTCLNDVTARDIQQREGRYTRAKGFDTFAPCGPWLWTGVDAGALHVSTRVNGELRQSSPTSDMIFDVAQVLSFISHIMTLEPGDIVSTGTPSGVGPLVHGDEVCVTLAGDGREPIVLRNPVRAAGAA